MLIEYEAAFCRLLRKRFPDVCVLQGDAYTLPRTLADFSGQPIRARSSLACRLLNQPLARRSTLIGDAFDLLTPGGVFVQFTYGVTSPVPRTPAAGRLRAHATSPIWLNLPPARVWTYRADPTRARHASTGRRRGREGRMLYARRPGVCARAKDIVRRGAPPQAARHVSQKRIARLSDRRIGGAMQKTIPARERMIVALDMPQRDQAEQLVAQLGDAVIFYKVGMELAYGGGLGLVEKLAASGKKVFLDLKLHDIPNTVERAVAQVARLGATFLTIHAYPQTMRAAVAGRQGSALKLLGVSVLTSCDDADLREAAMPSASKSWSRGAARRPRPRKSTAWSPARRRRRVCAPIWAAR